MDTLHSETLDFLVLALKAKHKHIKGLKSAARRRVCTDEIIHLRHRITLEFHYQTHGKRAGDSPK